MTPQKETLSYVDNSTIIDFDSSLTQQTYAARYGFADSYVIDGDDSTSFKSKGVAWNGHTFEVIDVNFRVVSGGTMLKIWLEGESHEINMLLHYPVDSRLTEEDCEGATLAEPNDDNDGWLFTQGNADHMRDREIELRAGLVAVLQPTIDRMIESVVTATENKPRDWPIGTPWENKLVRRTRLDEMLSFRDKAIACLLDEARERHIGWYHQNDAKSHLHNLVHDCIATTYRENSDTFSNVSSQIMQAAATLAPHAYETRWDKAARLKKEAAAREAENE